MSVLERKREGKRERRGKSKGKRERKQKEKGNGAAAGEELSSFSRVRSPGVTGDAGGDTGRTDLVAVCDSGWIRPPRMGDGEATECKSIGNSYVRRRRKRRRRTRAWQGGELVPSRGEELVPSRQEELVQLQPGCEPAKLWVAQESECWPGKAREQRWGRPQPHGAGRARRANWCALGGTGSQGACRESRSVILLRKRGLRRNVEH